MSLKTDSQQPAKRPRELSAAAVAQRRAAASSRWGGRGKAARISIDEDAAADLLTIPERDRRRVASDGILAAVLAYRHEVKART